MGSAYRFAISRPLILLRRTAEARRTLDELIRDIEALRISHPNDLMPICLLASLTTGQEHRDAYLRSAAAWHAWPATSFTQREEQKDLAAANR